MLKSLPDLDISHIFVSLNENLEASVPTRSNVKGENKCHRALFNENLLSNLTTSQNKTLLTHNCEWNYL